MEHVGDDPPYGAADVQVSSSGDERDEVHYLRNEELALDGILRVVANDEDKARETGDLVPVDILREVSCGLDGCFANDLTIRISAYRIYKTHFQVRTFRTRARIRPRTLIDVIDVMVSAIFSHRAEPIPPSTAARMSSSRTILTVLDSSFPTSAQMNFWTKLCNYRAVFGTIPQQRSSNDIPQAQRWLTRQACECNRGSECPMVRKAYCTGR